MDGSHDKAPDMEAGEAGLVVNSTSTTLCEKPSTGLSTQTTRPGVNKSSFGSSHGCMSSVILLQFANELILQGYRSGQSNHGLVLESAGPSWETGRHDCRDKSVIPLYEHVILPDHTLFCTH